MRIVLFSFVGTLLISCVSTKKIDNGRTAFTQKQYAVAIPLLEKEIQNNSDTKIYAELSYLLGESYKYLNDTDNSLKWFIESAKNDYGPEAFYEMAYALRKKQRYEDAILSYLRLEKMVARPEEVRKEIEKCRQAQLMAADREHPYIVEPLPISSDASDYAPWIYKGDKIVFTSDRKLDQDHIADYKWTGRAYSDLYLADLDGMSVSSFDQTINTAHNEGSASFSIGGDEMFYTFCHSSLGDSYCQIYTSKIENGSWTPGKPAFRMKPKVNYGDPVLIEDDQVLVFVSNDPTGIGGHDLYYSLREENDSWSEPELMPVYLNSIGQERFPRWHKGTLYYSSDFFAGLGGLDLFKTHLNEDGSWSKPENMLAPFNSSEDDFGLVFMDSSRLESRIRMKAFFTSSRGLLYNDDIYQIIELIPEDEIVIVPVDTVKITEVPIVQKSFFLNINIVEKQFAVPDNPNSYVVGIKPLANASVRINNNRNLLTTDAKGNSIISLDTLTFVDILAGKEGFLNRKATFNKLDQNTENLPDGHIFRLTIELDKLFEGVPVILDNIYYDYNEHFIREDAKPALNTLVKLLDENPAIKIELASHTDCRGENEYNLQLSQRRAAAAIDYIIQTGQIRPDRLTAVGMGETQLEEHCQCEKCSEDQHQVNRRTTFKISMR